MRSKNLSVLIVISLVMAIAVWIITSNISEPLVTNDTNVKPTVIATIFPLYDFVKIIAGDDVDVDYLLSSGASPHTFELTPHTIQILSKSQKIFAIGHGLDDWVLNLADDTTAELVYVDDTITLRTSGENVDPHYWLDPNNAREIAKTIERELADLMPEAAERFKNRRTKFFEVELIQKDKEWQAIFSNIESKKLIAFHDAFGYFADHFGLDIVATFEPFPGAEPTPRDLIALQNIVEAQNIRAIFLEPQLATKSVEAFAVDVGVEIAILDPLGGDTGKKNYIELIDFNVQQIVNALQ